MDFLIRNMSNTIINYINSVELPTEVKRLVVKDILDQLEKTSDSVIKAQIKALEQKEQTESEVEEDV